MFTEVCLYNVPWQRHFICWLSCFLYIYIKSGILVLLNSYGWESGAFCVFITPATAGRLKWVLGWVFIANLDHEPDHLQAERNVCLETGRSSLESICWVWFMKTRLTGNASYWTYFNGTKQTSPMNNDFVTVWMSGYILITLEIFF